MTSHSAPKKPPNLIDSFALLHELPVGVLVLDRGGNLHYANHCAAEILDASETLTTRGDKQHRVESCHPNDLSADLKQLTALAQSDDEVVITRPLSISPNDSKTLRWRLRELPHGDDELILVLIEDISDRSLHEKYLLISERLAAQAEMASTVTHRLNNYLTVIGNHSALIQKYLADGNHDAATASARKVSDRIMKIKDFMEHIVRLAEPEVELKPTSVAKLLADISLKARADRSIRPARIKINVDADVPEVYLDSIMIQAAIVELLHNAVEATLASHDQHLGQLSEIRVTADYVPESERFLIEVSDRGCGMPSDIVDEVFEPHFTTKTGRHGLGLTNVRRAARAHGGRVTIDSTPGRGTTVKLEIPAAKDRTDRA